MNLSGNTVLITGGSSGIGFALASRFNGSGSKVIICGRDMDKLDEAKRLLPGITAYQCDVSNEEERNLLFNKTINEFPELNIIVNNAGIQQRIKLTEPPEWSCIKKEIEINLMAQIHMSLLFIPHLLKAKNPAILNITSGLAFSPLAIVPVYCSTKAAFHSFTLSLRHQLTGTSLRVVEIAPPAVQTDLGGKGLHDFGTPLDEFADAVMPELEKDKIEITYGFSSKSSRASRDELDEMFNRMNNG